VLRTAFVFLLLAIALVPTYQSRAMMSAAPRSPLYGIWAVDEWRIGGAVRPPLITDAAQWRRVVFDRPLWMGVQSVSGTRQRYLLTLDPAAHSLALKRPDNSAWSSTLTYARPAPGLLTLTGTPDGRPVRARLHHEAAGRFLPVRRGFHWVNEFPYNR